MSATVPAQPPANRVRLFRRRVLEWHDQNARDFPWRASDDPYSIVIAETLLQQTSATRVATFLPHFIMRMPNWKALASADQRVLETLLQPLGLYRRRASSLKRLAMTVLKNDGLPTERGELEQLPGIGQYISSAILTTIYGKAEPLLDVNMSRVLERFFGPRRLADIRYDPYLQHLARRVTRENSLTTSWAILDFAAIVCLARTPKCSGCTLRRSCRFAAKREATAPSNNLSSPSSA